MRPVYKNPFLHFFSRVYGWWIRLCSRFQPLFLFILRLMWGIQFMRFGGSKLASPETTAEFFTNLHIPAPLFHAYFVGFFEWVGGLCLVLGFASRIITIPLIIIMLTAYSTAHVDIFYNWQFIKNPTIIASQRPFAYLLTSAMILFFGPGGISLDGWIKRWLKGKQI